MRRSSCICGHPKVTHRTYARFHACTKRVVGRQCRCQSYRLMPDALREALTDLHEHFAGEKLTLIWDGLPAHKSKAMKAWLATQRHWLHTEMLPGYAHDLNPIEMVWGNIKQRDLANLCPDTIDQAHTAAETGLKRVGTDYDMCMAFLAHTPLSL